MFQSKVFTLSKKDLKSVPFQLVYEDGAEGQDQRKAFAKYSTWALPQALAFVGQTTPVKNPDGQFDGNATVKKFVSSCEHGKEWAIGLMYYLLSHPRGLIIPSGYKATSPEFIPYAALVPLILAAFKKYQSIPYSKWTNFSSIVDKDLYAAMNCSPPSYTVEELLDLRDLGSTIKSGDKAGTKKNPVSTTTITATGVEEFDKLPRLAKIMLTQVWLAHATIRHDYMVLDPVEWDRMPPSLVATEVRSLVTSSTPDWAL